MKPENKAETERQFNVEIVRVQRRYWWPHPIYREARRNRYNCFKPGRPYVDITVGHRYFLNGQPFDLNNLDYI